MVLTMILNINTFCVDSEKASVKMPSPPPPHTCISPPSYKPLKKLCKPRVYKWDILWYLKTNMMSTLLPNSKTIFSKIKDL